MLLPIGFSHCAELLSAVQVLEERDDELAVVVAARPTTPFAIAGEMSVNCSNSSTGIAAAIVSAAAALRTM